MLDKIIIEVDKIVKTLTLDATSKRPNPAFNVSETELTDKEKKHAAGLMRVNHCGEICAQGLYQGQALTSRDKTNQAAFEAAAFEEIEHLAWTQQRISELGGYRSKLNPLFYMASLSLGITAGLIGDKWNLGFLEETERQVERHLASHLQHLPNKDAKSRAIVEQMKNDEAEHAEMAHNFGAAALPVAVKNLMQLSSSVMTKISYYI